MSRIIRSFCFGSLSATSRASATIVLSLKRNAAVGTGQHAVATQVLEEQQRADPLVPVGEGVVLDEEVEEMSRADLDAGIERLAIEGLLDVAENRLELIAALLAEEARSRSAASDGGPQAHGWRREHRRESRDRLGRRGRAGASASRRSSYSSSSRHARV